jgi:hypothetical protein
VSRQQSDGHEHYLEEARQKKRDNETSSFLMNALVVLLVIGFIGFLTSSAQKSDMRRQQESDGKQLDLYRLAEAWRADVEASASHGGRGIEPPMLEVTDYGSEVIVVNISGRPLECVSVHRSAIRSATQTFPTPCPMQYECRNMSADENRRQSFQLRPQSPKDCLREPLIFKIGGPQHRSAAWISEELLSEFDRNHRITRQVLVDSGRIEGPSK